MHFALLASLLPTSPLPPAPPFGQETLYEIAGLGSGAATVGDFDGDGIGDLLIGSNALVSGRKGVVLVRGLSLLNPLPSVLNDRRQHGLGDLDGDGIPEIQNGAEVISGADLLTSLSREGSPTPLFSFAPPVTNSGVLGGAVPLADLDGDGIPELLLGWPDAAWFRCPSDSPRPFRGQTFGAAVVQSAGTPLPLTELPGDSVARAFGGVVERLGDLDRDGFDDFAVATREAGSGYFCNLPGGNVLRVYSAQHGTLLWEHDAAPLSIAGLDDVDRDGIPDVALGFPYMSVVELRSGADGGLIAHIAHPPAQGFDLFGFQLVPLVDMDGDGKRELAIAAPQPLLIPIGFPGSPFAAGPGHVNVLGTRTLTLIADLSGKVEGEEFGADVELLGDVNGDGRAELLVESRLAQDGPKFRVITLKGRSDLVLKR